MNADARAQLKRDYVWNTASGIMASASTVIMLLVVTRVSGIGPAGLFALAFAVGQQLQSLGMYEVRYYQATDVRRNVSFGTYHATRIITVALMLIGVVVYPLFTGRPASDVILLALIAGLRCVDAFEDVFFGELQRRGRLDIAGRAYFWRVFITTVVFSVVLIVTKDLFLTTTVTLIASVLAMVVLVLLPSRKFFAIRPLFTLAPIRALLIACFPLFLSAFLAIYLSNAPRFVIANYLSDEMQGYFAILFMPAFTINLLATLIFRPLLTRMADAWSDGDSERFRQIIVRGLQAAVGSFVVTLAITYFFGVPLLDLVYGQNIGPYKSEMLVLVVGGAFNAIATVLYYGLTTFRRQKVIFAGFATAAVTVSVLSIVWIAGYGILGAALAYAAAMFVLTVFFAVALQYYRGRLVPGESLNT